MAWKSYFFFFFLLMTLAGVDARAGIGAEDMATSASMDAAGAFERRIAQARASG